MVKPTNIIEALEYFVFDVMGILIPGLIFLLLVTLLLEPSVSLLLGSTITPQTSTDWVLVGLVAYALGYVLQGVGECVEKILHTTPYSRLPWHKSYQELREEIETSKTFTEARSKIGEYIGSDLDGLDFRKVRNLAMSIALDLRQVYKFMYISQLCLGVATACILVVLLIAVQWTTSSAFNSPPGPISINWALLTALFISWMVLMSRRGRYYSISMRIPFPIALAEIARGGTGRQGRAERDSLARETRKQGTGSSGRRVYLSGGLRSNWQDVVIEECKNMSFLDPRRHGLSEAGQYTVWDLHSVKESDIVFAYMEKDNPSGYGLALEVGYAKALGKTVILADERSGEDESFAKYFRMVQETADYSCPSLREAVAFLKSFERGAA